MTRALSAEVLSHLLSALRRPAALVELAVVMGCLVLAWALVRLLRGAGGVPGSIWFGERVVDGVLFPVVALNVSAWAEGYRWTAPALLGLALVMAGNVLVFRKPRPAP